MMFYKYLTVILLLVSFPVQAATIAIADADYLMNASSAAKDIKSQLKDQQDNFKKEFKSAEALLKKEEQAILAQKKDLSQNEFADKATAFQKKMADEKNRFDQKQVKLEAAFSVALKDLQKEIGLLIQEVAKEKNIDIVIQRQAILYAAAGQLDLTQEVLKRLDAKKKSIKVKVP